MSYGARGSPAFLATLPAGPRERRLALAVLAFSLVFFLAAAPFAKVQLAPVAAFIPICQSALVVNDLITAALLFGQFRILCSRALAVLAAGYLFTAGLAVVHMLSFPGLFAPQGLLGAGPQSTAWLYMFWHAGFPLFVMAYAWRRNEVPAGRTDARTIAAFVAGALLLATAAALAATAGHDHLPAIMVGNRYSSAMIVVVASVWAFSLLALVLLWRRRPHSVLDLWLMVVLCAWLFDIALSAMLNGGRFDLGFYAGRIYGLLAATFVLIVLLLENAVLYTWLVESHRREHDKGVELARLGGELENLNGVLVEKNRQLEEASRRKSEFLASMSHELRTPLNAIIGFSEVLKDGMVGELRAQQREYVNDIFTSGRHLLELINDILDLSKVEAGKMTLDLERAEIGALLESSLAVVREKAANRGIALTHDIASGLPPLQLDVRRTKQIVYNLLSNAVKFTPDGGGVALRARRVSRQAVAGWSSERPACVRCPLPTEEFAEYLEITVEDSAMGISPADAARLFQPFSQLDGSLARRFEGTGLGLAMVLKLAQLHGGTVAVASEPGKGSCFTVWLPWRPLPAPEGRAGVADAAAGPVALVVEDDDAAAELLRLHLAAEGLQVLRVANAEAALALVGTPAPRLIVLDLLLPGIDGWEFLTRIKRAGSRWADVPVVIVSIVADARKGFSLGAAQVLQKPVGRADLQAALDRLGLHGRESSGAKVLVVDDDPLAVELVAACLPADCTVLRAADGRRGIEMARQERPDLMILDLLMPEVSGFDVVEALKAEADTASIPVIMVTNKDLSEVDRRELNGNVTAILAKAAFTPDRFAAEVRRALYSERQKESV